MKQRTILPAKHTCPPTAKQKQGRREANAMQAGLLVLAFAVSFTTYCQPKLDSLLTALKTATHDTTKINLLNDIAWQLKFSYPDSALTYANQALTVIASLRAGKRVGAKQSVHMKQWLQKAKAKVISTIGAIYYLKGDYPKAIGHHQRSLKIFEAIADKNGEASGLNNLGAVYYEQGNYPKAIDHYQHSLKISEAIGDKNGEASSLNNLGGVYHHQGDYPKAIDHYRRSLKIQEAIGNKKGEACSINNLGFIYYEQGDYPNAIDHYQRSLKIKEAIGDKEGEASSLTNLGILYSETGNTTAAIEYCLKSLAIACKIGALPREMGACECLSGAWESDSKSGSHSAASKLRSALKALEYHKLWAIAKDSLFNEEKTKEITRLVTRYEMEKQYEAEKRAAEEVAVAVAEKKARSSLVQISVIGLVLGLVLLAILFSGRFAIPAALAKVVVFVSIVFLFEFILVLLDPFVATISGGNPAIQLLCNGAVALLVFPLFNFLLTRLTQRVSKTSVGRRKIERRKYRK